MPEIGIRRPRSVDIKLTYMPELAVNRSGERGGEAGVAEEAEVAEVAEVEERPAEALPSLMPPWLFQRPVSGCSARQKATSSRLSATCV